MHKSTPKVTDGKDNNPLSTKATWGKNWSNRDKESFSIIIISGLCIVLFIILSIFCEESLIWHLVISTGLHLALAFFIFGLAETYMGRRAWIERFEKGISNLMVQKEYLLMIDDAQAEAMAIQILRRIYSFDTHHSDSIIEHIVNYIHEQIPMPYRRNYTSSLTIGSISHMQNAQQRYTVKNTIVYQCKKGSKGDIIEYIQLMHDKDELKNFTAVSVKTETADGLPIEDLTDLAEIKEQGNNQFGFSIQISDAEGYSVREFYKVRIEVEFEIEERQFFYHTIRYPTKNSTFIVNCPPECFIFFKTFCNNNYEIIKYDFGQLHISFAGWLLKNEGIAFQAQF